MNKYQKFYLRVLGGESRLSRGMWNTAIYETKFTADPGVMYGRPGTSTSIGFIEALQFIAGEFRMSTFKRLTPNARLDLFTHQSAYGPRAADQFDGVINELNADHRTRRATLMIARHDDTPESRPCTMFAQFQVDALSELRSTFFMRSSDLVWGLPTDLIQFGAVAQMIASCTSLPLGPMAVISGNSHVYEATKLGVDQRFTTLGAFSIPYFPYYNQYKIWAKDALDDLDSGRAKISDVFDIIKEDHDE